MLKVIRHAIRANAHVIRDDGRAINETGFYRSKAGKVVAEIVVKQKEIDGITDGLQYVYRVAGSRIDQIAESGAIKMRPRITSTVRLNLHGYQPTLSRGFEFLKHPQSRIPDCRSAFHNEGGLRFFDERRKKFGFLRT
jgi:hypothetical protein